MMGLVLGSGGRLHVRHEHVPARGGARLRLLYASDLHLRRDSHALVKELLRVVGDERPELVLLGGDLVDSRLGSLRLFDCVGRLSALSPVLAVAGNHDRFWGLEGVRAAVEAGGGHWIEGRSTRWPMGNGETVFIDGEVRSQRVRDRQGTRVLCGHDPEVFPRAASAGYELVLAGHLHGGQCVLAQSRGRLYPGAFFYRFNGLRFRRAGSEMLVSRGAADTLPIRFNCPREVILCELS